MKARHIHVAALHRRCNTEITLTSTLDLYLETPAKFVNDVAIKVLDLRSRLKGAVKGIDDGDRRAMERVTREHSALREGLGAVEKVCAHRFHTVGGGVYTTCRLTGFQLRFVADLRKPRELPVQCLRPRRLRPSRRSMFCHEWRDLGHSLCFRSRINRGLTAF